MDEHKLAQSSAEAAYQLMSGQRSGVGGAIGRGCLAMAAAAYAGVVKTRYAMFAAGLRRAHRAGAPVISVGNITTGGTGKTPMVEWVARHIGENLNRKVAVLSRGYRTHHVFDKDGQVLELNDESMQLRENCPNAVMIQNAKRRLGAREAVEQHGAQALVLDDGFQHLQLHRDLDIVLIDAMLPFGFGHMLPRGLLREPASGLKRAQAVVITRASHLPAGELDELRDKLRALAPQALLCTADHEPWELEDLGTGASLSPSRLKDKRIYLISGIANPTAFRVTVRDLGAKVVHHSAMEDHYLFTEADVAGFSHPNLAKAVDYFVVTQKDAVKLKRMFDLQAGAPVLSLKIRMKLRDGEQELRHLVDTVIGGAAS